MLFRTSPLGSSIQDLHHHWAGFSNLSSQTPLHFTCPFTHLAQPGLAVFNKALTWQHVLPMPFYWLGESGDHIAKHEFPHSPITKFSLFVGAYLGASEKQPVFIKSYKIWFQTCLSGCLASLSRKEPLYCNLFKTAVLLSLTDHFICLKTTLHGKNKKVDLFPDASRKNLIDICSSEFVSLLYWQNAAFCPLLNLETKGEAGPWS